SALSVFSLYPQLRVQRLVTFLTNSRQQQNPPYHRPYIATHLSVCQRIILSIPKPGDLSMDNNKLSVKEKIGYGMGDAGCNIIFG
ncbi:hypothetical protein, partial [Acinetobacter geminorum]|uniref:hypothetical protein n=1 Tax=Acinetobacter geminorum TaxID=2730922 RepID=UPI001C087B25